MTDVLRFTVAVAVLLLLAVSARAGEQTTFYGPDGRVTGRAVPDSSGSIRYYDANGRSTGSSTTDSGGTTHFYDQNGRSAGSATRPAPPSEDLSTHCWRLAGRC
jgi:hypothetical protein